jgi:endonuclease YncB( thermonuclease family)
MRRAIVCVAVLLCLASWAAAADDAIWTSKPVRVDPAKQNFERLPRLVLGLEGGESITFPSRLDMNDSASFTAGGVTYRIKDIKAIAPNRLCQSDTGARWPCGKQSAIFAANLFRGKTFVCKVERLAQWIELSGCRTARMDIPREIVAQGFGFPAGSDVDLQTAMMTAKLRRAGVWNDAACATAFHSC